LRPLLRRRLIMARPARVAIRARKPCVRARRMRLGLYVKLIITPEKTAGNIRQELYSVKLRDHLKIWIVTPQWMKEPNEPIGVTVRGL